nr:ADP-ribosylglycohydrolase family protein [Propioniciclava coleopterorum]
MVGPWFDDWENARPMSPYHKGDGRVTDDTLMTHAMIDTYERVGGHLTAFDVASTLVPIMMSEPRWIPELEKTTVILNRVFLAEKWIVLRCHYSHADPREAGVGNVVNCGAAMYMAPVGAVNAGDPDAAYAEAMDIAGAHQSSYGREAAGVYAAAVAAALAPGATAASVFEAALSVAHDGTRAALAAVRDAVASWDRAVDLQPILRAAILPYDTVGETYREPNMDARKPSRTKAIEELPIALGYVLAHDGDYRAAVLGAVNYGRDCDSIATMAGAICAGLGGTAVIPDDWADEVAAASRIDLEAAGRRLAAVAATLAAADAERAARTLEIARARAASLQGATL